MREFKFRAWIRCQKKMIYSNEIKCGTNNINIDELFAGDGCYEYMQYTGLKDKNGEDIYEGDILKFDVYISEIEYDFGCFVLKSKNFYNGTCFNMIKNKINEWEVIGNIYENSNLFDNKSELLND